MLLQQIEQQPETMGLKRLLAVKKSLLEFEQRVEHVMKVVQQLMTDNKVRGWGLGEWDYYISTHHRT